MPGQQGGIEQKPETGEKPITVEDIRAQTGDLKKRLAEMDRQKQERIKKNISDREELITQEKGTFELLDEAKESLKYYEDVESKGNLDLEGQKELEKLRELIISLEQRVEEIVKKIKDISDNKEVLGRLQDEADAGNRERTQAKEIKERQEELIARIDKIIEELRNLFLQRAELDSDEWKTEIRPLIGDSHLGMMDALGKSESAIVFYGKLRGFEENLGMLSFKKKATIGKVRERLEDLINKSDQERGKLDAEEGKLTNDFKKVKEEYNNLDQSSNLARNVGVKCHVCLRKGIEGLQKEMPKYENKLNNFLNRANS